MRPSIRSLGLGLTTLVYTACWPLSGSRDVTVPQPKLSTSQARVPETPPSTAVVEVAIPISWVRDVAESKIPKENIGAHAWTDIDGSRAQFRHAIRRRSIEVSARDGRLILATNIIYKLKARFRVTE